jgi:hypothetical protein
MNPLSGAYFIKMPMHKFLSLLIAFFISFAAACTALEAGFERSPTPDYAAVGTLASLMVTGTHSAMFATQMAVPHTPTPTTGLVSGRICYPSDRIPAMTLYFSQPETGRLIEQPIRENQASYQVELEPGSYFVFAWVANFQVGGMYTQAVLCGMGDDCTDHNPVSITISAGHLLEDIDVCDWVHPEEDLPFPTGGLTSIRQAGN